jgi:hypothetical protein
VKYKEQFKDSSKFCHIPAELIEAGSRTIFSEIQELINLFGIRRNCLRSGRSQSLYLLLRRVIKHCSNYTDISYV